MASDIVLGLRTNGARFKASFYRLWRIESCGECGLSCSVEKHARGIVVCFECADRLGFEGVAALAAKDDPHAD